MRTKLSWGEAPQDKKGMDARTFAMRTEEAFSEVYKFLSGNSSEVTLPTTGIPTAKGGTGSITVAGARANLGLYIDCNYNYSFGTHMIKLFNDRVSPLDGSRVVTFTKVAEGIYYINGVTAYGLEGVKYILPKDSLGNVLFGCTVEFETNPNRAKVQIHPVEYVDGKCVAITTAHMEIPDGVWIDINLR